MGGRVERQLEAAERVQRKLRARHAAMLAAADEGAVYGEVPIYYRDPASCLTLPEIEADSNAARTTIPRKPERRSRRRDCHCACTPLSL